MNEPAPVEANTPPAMREQETNVSAASSRNARSLLAMFFRLAGLPGVARRLEGTSSAISEHQRDVEERSFVLRVVQPGLAGLMDGSVSTLAPIFAVAFITGVPFNAFRVGMATAVGAGISMAFAEGLSDDGALTGRGNPLVRGGVTGVMTFIGGSLHTLPFLIPTIHGALLAAYIVVAIELVLIAAIRHRFFGTNWAMSMAQVVGGGALVFAAAVLFGAA
ncbi:MAG TPA: VIT family protein [Ktedonobacterales bacterium]|nr:VIT family protein [Ktedonobacterales bacterium]